MQGQSRGRWSRPWSSPEWSTRLGGTKVVNGFEEGRGRLHAWEVDRQAAFGGDRR